MTPGMAQKQKKQNITNKKQKEYAKTQQLCLEAFSLLCRAVHLPASFPHARVRIRRITNLAFCSSTNVCGLSFSSGQGGA